MRLMVELLGAGSTLSQRRDKLLLLIGRVIVPFVLASVSALVYLYVLVYPWVIVTGVIDAYISPLTVSVTYMGLPLRDPTLESSMTLAKLLGLLVIAVNLLLGISHLPFMSYRVRGSLAYTSIVISFIYSFVIIPSMFIHVQGFLEQLDIGSPGTISSEAGSGTLVYGNVDVYLGNPIALAYAAFMFSLISVVYVFYELYTRL